ncbi:MAG: tRNA uridine-5-carboxymethylaminomethyl(34) synthesis GTPase MnmE [Ruminococcus sp.]|jgi:tRNA modification GTPase|nr:tRNA uridine-5-carboxymethylaminomethyl(34) synthesis GTPase MnmE [Ruminococcus sp.]
MIAAIATPRGEGGIAVVRLSGEGVFGVAEKVFTGLKKPGEMAGYTCTFGHITDGEQIIDECVLTVFRAPHSYTGEDTAEFSVHGGDFTARKTLALLIKNGARAARAGEFTERAVLNGKMNLTQAEAVADIIGARAENELRFANAMKSGLLFTAVSAVREKLINLAADIGVADDYPDDYGEVSPEHIKCVLTEAKSELLRLTGSFAAGSIIKSGIPTAIIGKPNAGKSSLMNLLLGVSRSIVTDIPGTTRDIVDGFIEADGYTLRLIDTAGLRETGDRAEEIGVSLAREAAGFAGITLAVFDLSREADPDDRKTLELCKNGSTVAVFNKNDRERAVSAEFIAEIRAKMPAVYISAKTGEGIEQLRGAIGEIIAQSFNLTDTEVLLTERQFLLAKQAESDIENALRELEAGVSSDITGVLVSEAALSLSKLTGETITEEIARDIFARFCVGK